MAAVAAAALIFPTPLTQITTGRLPTMPSTVGNTDNIDREGYSRACSSTAISCCTAAMTRTGFMIVLPVHRWGVDAVMRGAPRPCGRHLLRRTLPAVADRRWYRYRARPAEGWR